MRELEKAVALDPTLGKAYGHLGCLQLDDGRSAEAEASLAKARALEPDFVVGQICQARLKASAGDLDGAIEDIGFLMLRNSRNDHLHYVLGLMLEEKSDPAAALREYRKAYELLEKRARTE
jgi:tetratricopeptide (TPR) repeat protein